MRINISDIRDPWSIRYLVQGQDFIFNLAGQVSHIDSMEDPETDLDINCRGQLSLLEACRENNPEARIVFAASRQQYGRPQFVPVTEDHPLVPVDVNGINLDRRRALPPALPRGVRHPGVVAAPDEHLRPAPADEARPPGLHHHLHPAARSRARTIQVFGDGSQLRDFTYVSDAVDAFLAAGADRRDLRTAR